MSGTDNASYESANSSNTEHPGLLRRLKTDVVFVVSAIGTALTVISTLKDTVTVASWARALLDGFQFAASGFWALILPWLSVLPKPMDVLFLNMSVFLAVIAIGSLSSRADVPSSWRELNWRRELMAILGAFSAIALFVWAGYSSIQEHLDGDAAKQFMNAIESVKTVEESEAAALTFMSEISAFAPGIDWFGQVVGLTSGPLQERVHTDFMMMVALYIVIINVPFCSIIAAGAFFGTRWDSRKASRWIWLFVALVAATFALGWISDTWSAMCANPQGSATDQICGLID